MIDPKQLTDLWDQHAARVVLLARALGDSADDAVQEAFVSLACQRKVPDDPLAWLVQVTRNRMRQWHRSGQRRRNREVGASDTNWFQTDSVFISSIEDRLDATKVTAALIELPSPEREIIVMHIWGEMTFQDISEIVELSRASAHRAYQQGIERLRKQFLPHAPQIENTDSVSLPSRKLCHE